MDNHYLQRLRRRAVSLDKVIRKDRATGGYYLIELYGNYVVKGPAELEEIEVWLNWAEQCL